MMDWFYNWLDPKILRVEKWVNMKVIEVDKIDLDLDKVKKGEVRDNPMFRQPPDTGDHGPFLTNLQDGDILEHLVGPGQVEAFALIEHQQTRDHAPELWWRHRDAGTTEDFRHAAFADMKAFFEYTTGNGNYWDCVLRTKALEKNEA